jgi:uncharacterized protein (TIGR02001 family)
VLDLDAQRAASMKSPSADRIVVSLSPMTRSFVPLQFIFAAQLVLMAMQPAAAGEATQPALAESQHGVSASLGVASEYVVHGLARSLGEPVVNASLGYGFGQGWLVAARASTMNLNVGPGPSRELGLYLGNNQPIGEDWELGASIARYEYWRNTRFLPYDYTEATLEATWRSQLRIRLQYSPDYSLVSRRGPAREFDTWTGELLYSFPLVPGVSLATAVGYYDLTAGLEQGYFYWSCGIVGARGRVTLALNYVGVDHTAKAMFNPAYTRDRLIATLALRVR